MPPGFHVIAQHPQNWFVIHRPDLLDAYMSAILQRRSLAITNNVATANASQNEGRVLL